MTRDQAHSDVLIDTVIGEHAADEMLTYTLTFHQLLPLYR